MGDGKYYWLRLDRNFFKRHDIRIIENMENGKEYVLFYMKLLLESIDHEGSLRFNELIPYKDSMLATITNTNVDIVRSAVKLFQSLDLMEILDDKTIYMTETQKMLGEAKSTARVQRFREKQKVLAIETVGNVTETLHETEIEIEKEKDIKDIGQKSDLATELFNQFWDGYPRHVSKATAEKSFKKLKVTEDILSKMLHSLDIQKQSRQWSDKQFIPHPATWLNQRRWEDESEEPKSGGLIQQADGSFKLE